MRFVVLRTGVEHHVFVCLGANPEREIERRGQRAGVEHVGHAVGASHEEGRVIEEDGAGVRCLRHSGGVGVCGVRVNSGILAGAEPALHQRAGHGRDRRADGRLVAAAHGEMQALDLRGELLLECERHRLCKPCAAAQR